MIVISPINSKDKGKRAELAVAKLCREAGFDGARRGQQFSGANGDADCVGVPGIHMEVKHVESLNIFNAMDQSIRDAKPDEIPTVFHKKNNKPWLVTMKIEDFFRLYRGEVNGQYHFGTGKPKT